MEQELQTHWMGEDGSMFNRYRLGEQVEEFAGIGSAILDGTNDDFIAHCSGCAMFWHLGATISNCAVIEVWNLPGSK
jgi:hypothetical protein